LMVAQLDHLMVPARDKIAAAQRLAEILGVAWAAAGVGPFAPVYVNDGLTLDFDEWPEPVPVLHVCFRVNDIEFERIIERLRVLGVPFRSSAHGPVDYQVDTARGGRNVYWSEPDGHYWELLTQSYARPSE